MKGYALLLLVIFSGTLLADNKCYKLKDVMKDESIGNSHICFHGNLKKCFFTSDEIDYTHTFEVPCVQFFAVEKHLKNNPELNVFPFIKK